MVAGRSPEKAWKQTRSDWKPELLYALVGGVLSIVVLTIAGWPEGHASYFIPLGSALGAALLVPFVQFIWRLTWQPWDSLKSDVAAIRAKVEESSPAPVQAEKAKTKKPIDVRLTALNYIRTYDDAQGTNEFAFRRKEAISRWTDQVVHFLAEHVGGDAVERILKAEPEDRRDVMAEIAEGL